MLDLYLKLNYTFEFNRLNSTCSSGELSGLAEEEVSSKRPRQMRDKREEEDDDGERKWSLMTF